MFRNWPRLLLVLAFILALLPLAPRALASGGVRFTITAKSAFGRDAPSLSGAKLVSLFQGQSFPAVGRSNDVAWVQIDLGAPPGSVWVSVSTGTFSGGDIWALPVTGAGQIVIPTTDPNAINLGATATPTLGAAPAAGPVIAPPITSATFTVTFKKGVKVRSGPDLVFPAVGSAINGTTFGIRGRSADSTWLWIDYPGVNAETWVLRSAGKVNGDLGAVPVAVSLAPTPTPVPVYIKPPEGTLLNPLGFKPSALANARTIFQRGQARGNDPHRFSRIGDSVSLAGANIGLFEPWKPHDLGDYPQLQAALDHFTYSFDRAGISSSGLTAALTLDPAYADPWTCGKDSPLVCEYKAWKPSVALIMLGTVDSAYGSGYFESNLRKMVRISLDMGVIPVLRTVPWHPTCKGYPVALWINDVVRLVAADYRVPLWDMYATLQALPNQGIGYFEYDRCGAHLSQFEDGTSITLRQPYLQYGQMHQDLEALQALYALLNNSMN